MRVIVLDTETANSLDDPLCYDIGWAVVDTETGEILKERSYAVAEIFFDKELMTSAYYAEKIPYYWDEIEWGERKIAKLKSIKGILRKDCMNYGVSDIYAHNARFDYKSCNTTQRYLTSSKYRYFFPYGTTICDTLKMARKAFNKDEDYCKFCMENGYRTKNNQNRLTAEVLYRYISGKNDFEEAHRGIDDVRIEKEILLECLRRGVLDGALWDD